MGSRTQIFGFVVGEGKDGASCF